MNFEASELSQERLRTLLKLSNLFYEIKTPARLSKDALTTALAQRCSLSGNTLSNRVKFTYKLKDIPTGRLPAKNLPEVERVVNADVKTALDKLPMLQLIGIADAYNTEMVVKGHIEKLSKEEMTDIVEQNFKFVERSAADIGTEYIGWKDRDRRFIAESKHTTFTRNLEGIAPAQVRRTKAQKVAQRNTERQATALEQLRRVEAETRARNVERRERRALPEEVPPPLARPADHEAVREMVREAQNLRAVQVGEQGEDARAEEAGAELYAEEDDPFVAKRQKYLKMYETYKGKPESMDAATYESQVLKNFRSFPELFNELGYYIDEIRVKEGDKTTTMELDPSMLINMKGNVYMGTKFLGRWNPMKNELKKISIRVKVAPAAPAFDPEARPKLPLTPQNAKKVYDHFKSQNKAAKYFGVVQSTISRALSKV